MNSSLRAHEMFGILEQMIELVLLAPVAFAQVGLIQKLAFGSEALDLVLAVFAPHSFLHGHSQVGTDESV